MLESFGVTLAYNDSQGKTGTTAVPTDSAEFNGANFEADITALGLAVDAVTLGQRANATRSWKTVYSTDSPPNAAQRHSKWLVRGVDDTFNSVTLTIPTADPTLEDASTGEMQTGATRTALEDALIAVWRHPITGKVVEIQSIELVGRTGV